MNTQREIADSQEAERVLQRGWPESIKLSLFQQSTWYELPYAFLPAFPSLALHQVRELAVFGRLLANSIFLHDPLADRPMGVRETAIASLRIMAMQFEATRALAPRVPPEARFWDRLRQYLADYAFVCVEELRFSAGDRPWHTLTEPVAIDIAIKKSGVSRAILAGLVELAGADPLLEPLVASLDSFNVACQMWDDLKDWRDDLSRRMPTLLLSRVLPELPAAEFCKAEESRIASELYRGGHARYVVELALRSLGRAEALRPAHPALPWWQLVDTARIKLATVQRDIEEFTHARSVATKGRVTEDDAAPAAAEPARQAEVDP